MAKKPLPQATAPNGAATHSKELGELTAEQVRDLAKKVGVIEEDYWLLRHHDIVYSELAKEKKKWKAWGERLTLSPDATLTLTPRAALEYCGDTEPLFAILRQGKADAELQRWLVDQSAKGAFSRRKSLIDRIIAQGDLYEAYCDFFDVYRLLDIDDLRRERAIKIAALHWAVPWEKLQTEVNRAKNDRHRLPILGPHGPPPDED